MVKKRKSVPKSKSRTDDSHSGVTESKPGIWSGIFKPETWTGVLKGGHSSGAFKKDVRTILETLAGEIQLLEKARPFDDCTKIWRSIDQQLDDLENSAAKKDRPEFERVCNALKEIFAEIRSQDVEVPSSFWKILLESLPKLAEWSEKKIVSVGEMSQLITNLRKETSSFLTKKTEEGSFKTGDIKEKQENVYEQNANSKSRSKKPLVLTIAALAGVSLVAVLIYLGASPKNNLVRQQPEVAVSKKKDSQVIASASKKEKATKPTKDIEPTPAVQIDLNQQHRAGLKFQPAQALKQYAIILHEKITPARKEAARKKLSQAMEELDRIYQEMSEFCKAGNEPSLSHIVTDCHERWKEIKNILLSSPSAAGFRKILSLSEGLEVKNENLIVQIGDKFHSNSSSVSNVAENLGLRVTQLTSDYLAFSLSIDKKKHLDKMLERKDQFEQTMQRLEGDPESNAQIRGVINSISKMEWRSLKKTINECSPTHTGELKEVMVVAFSDRIIKKSDRLATLYMELQNELTLR